MSQLPGSSGKEQKQSSTAAADEEDIFPAIGEAEDDSFPSSSGHNADSNTAQMNQLRGSSGREQQCSGNSGTRSADIDDERSTKKIKLTQEEHASQSEREATNRCAKRIKLIQDGSFQVAKNSSLHPNPKPKPSRRINKKRPADDLPPLFINNKEWQHTSKYVKLHHPQAIVQVKGEARQQALANSPSIQHRGKTVYVVQCQPKSKSKRKN